VPYKDGQYCKVELINKEGRAEMVYYANTSGDVWLGAVSPDGKEEKVVQVTNPFHQ
jgi:hypothetical protein